MNIFVFLSSIIFIVVLISSYCLYKYQYWKKKKVPYPKPSLFFGNTKDIVLVRSNIGRALQKIYREFDNEKFIGIYELTMPSILLRDPELIKLIFIKDASYFQARGLANSDGDPLTKNNLVNLTGRKWHVLRTKMNSTFTSGKMRYIFGRMVNAGVKLNRFVRQYAISDSTVEVKELAAKFTTEIITTCFFGLDTNTLQDEESEFRRMCRLALEPTIGLHIKRLMRIYFPNAFGWFLITLNPPKVTRYFMKLCKDMICFRETNKVTRQDFIQLLMEMRDSGFDGEIQHSDLVLDENLIAAQMYIFMIASFDTTAATLAFTMLELARNPNIQQRLHNEIQNTFAKHGAFTYDSISEMKYLHCVVTESLRKYPPLGSTQRICNEDYTIPGTEVIIEKGTKVILPIYAIHHDPKFYPEPEKYDPERFLTDNYRNNCQYLPFGAGPRMCIGLRLAYTQAKAGLAALLADYEILAVPETEFPVKLKSTSQTLTSEGGIWLKIRRRSQPLLEKYVDITETQSSQTHEG